MKRSLRSGALVASVVISGLCLPATARPDADAEVCHQDTKPERPIPAFDAATGRDLSTFPPDPLVDYQHMRLTLDIPDMNEPKLTAVQALSVRALGRPVASLTLDAHLLDVQSVSASGRTAKFENDGRYLTITFDRPLGPGEATEITTKYSVTDPPSGLFWTPESPAWPGRPAQIHTQGQSETNSYWFPCHDFPNERLTTELIVTVPDGYVVNSNGRLVEQAPAGSRETPGPDGLRAGRTTFHWLQDKPHVNYLVTMVVGKFDVVDVNKGGSIPMPVYVPPGLGNLVPATYARTPQMVQLFGRLTGQPYPWDRYAQLVVWNFGAGGMENTSATTMYDTAILTPEGLRDGDLDGLISHELAHQWFGDLITCRSWEHIWLNEGFATYFTALWKEQRDGADGYQAVIRGNFDSVLARDQAEAPYAKPMVTHAYTNAGQQFGGAANPYPKGSSILHMLRMKLGDEVFFRGLAAYVDRFKLKTAETADFRRTMEEVSGEDLLRFFRQWCQQPGVPELDVSIDYDTTAKEVAVTVKQTQNIDGYNPAFEFDLPLWASDGARIKPLGIVSVDSEETTARFKSAEPSVVTVDPEMHVLAKMTVHQPVDRWLAQLERGPTLAAKVQAARALAAEKSPDSAKSLVAVARNANAPDPLRVEAIEALQKRADAAALLDLGSATNLPPDAGVSVCEAAAKLAGDQNVAPSQQASLRSMLAGAAAHSTSQRVRAEAVRGLGRLKAADQLPLIMAAAETNSQHDRLRQAALAALGDLDGADGLPVAIRFAMPGAFNRTRPVAIEAIGALAHHDREAAFKALSAIVEDRESRAWRAAGPILAGLGDPRAVDVLSRLETAKRDPRDQETVHGWTEEARKKSATGGG